MTQVKKEEADYPLDVVLEAPPESSDLAGAVIEIDSDGEQSNPLEDRVAKRNAEALCPGLDASMFPFALVVPGETMLHFCSHVGLGLSHCSGDGGFCDATRVGAEVKHICHNASQDVMACMPGFKRWYRWLKDLEPLLSYKWLGT